MSQESLEATRKRITLGRYEFASMLRISFTVVRISFRAVRICSKEVRICFMERCCSHTWRTIGIFSTNISGVYLEEYSM